MPGTEVSVVIPVYNEAGNVAPLIAEIAAALHDRDWEAILVDDMSPDGTGEVVRRLSMTDDRVRLVMRVTERGLARAVIQGMLTAKADLLVVMDADGQHDAGVIRALLPPLERDEADLVSAARALDQAETRAALGAARLSLSRAGVGLCRLILRRDLDDPLTGFFAMRRAAFLRVAPRLGDPGFKILLDLLATDRTLRHREVPFRFGNRRSGQSKLGLFVAWQFAVFLIGRLLGGLLPPTFVSFLLVGLSGVAVHFAVLWMILLTGAAFSTAHFGAVLAATTGNFLLNNLLTFSERRLRGLALLRGYLGFLAVASIGIVASVGVATAIYEHVVHVVVPATLAGIAIDIVWKYALSSRIVWR